MEKACGSLRLYEDENGKEESYDGRWIVMDDELWGCPDDTFMMI